MFLRLSALMPLRIAARRLRTDEAGVALAAVMGLSLVGLLIGALILVTVISSFGTTTASRANVQAQAAAQAGVVAAIAGVQNPGTCSTSTPAGFYTSSTAPAYDAQVYVPNGTGWKPGCPNAASTQMRIVSSGYAANKGAVGRSSGDIEYVEAVYTLSGAGSGPSDGSIFNTGTNGNNGIAANLTADKVWQVAGPYAPNTTTVPLGSAVGLSPYTTTGTAPVFKPTTVGNLYDYAGGWWKSTLNNAQWIYLNDASQAVTGDWYYRYQFSLPNSAAASTFQLNISFLADNTVSEVWVNDVPQSSKTFGLPQNAPVSDGRTQYTGAISNSSSVYTNTRPFNPYWYFGYRIEQQAQTTLGDNWQVGLNTVLVLVKSAPTGEGFLAQMNTKDLGLCNAGYTNSSPPVAVTCSTPTLTYNRNVTSPTG